MLQVPASSPVMDDAYVTLTVDSSVGSLDALRYATSFPDEMVFMMRSSESVEVYGSAQVDPLLEMFLRLPFNRVGVNRVPCVQLTMVQFKRAALCFVSQRRISLHEWQRGNWQMVLQASPGHSEPLEAFLGEDLSVSPILAAIAVVEERFTMAWLDLPRATFRWCQYEDGPLLIFTEGLLVQTGVTEVLLIGSHGDRMLEMLDACGIPQRSVKPQSVDLSFLFKQNLASLSDQAQGVISVLAHHCSLLESDGNRQAFSVAAHQADQFMRLDDTALRCLNLFPAMPHEPAECSLFGLLNHCRTKQGSRQLAQAIRQPLMDPRAIEGRLNLVESLLRQEGVRLTLRETQLRGLSDLSRIIRRLGRNSATLQVRISLNL